MIAWRSVVRWLLFIYVVLVACPIRYWPQDPTLDNSWVFALNYGAAHGLAIGRDMVWTTGPLGYLGFPQDIGNNLAHGLAFQGITWLVLIAIFADLFFRHQFPLRNLTAFSAFFGLSAPLYWFNYMGIENLLLAGALVLMVVARWRENLVRYVLALMLVGIIPLIKLTGGILAGGAVIGFVLDKALRSGSKAWRDVILAATVPAVVGGIGCWLLLPSFDSFVRYLRTSLDLAGDYSVAMSLPGDPVELARAAGTVACIGVLLYAASRANREVGFFFLLLLAIPLFLSVKHGFVRPDFHVLNFFCFAGLALGLILLGMSLEDRRVGAFFLILVPYSLIWLESIGPRLGIDALEQATGIEALPLAYRAVRYRDLRPALEAQTRANWSKARVEPEIRAIVGQSPVASLSIAYSDAVLDGLNLKLYPVIQRYAAYTPYLDGLNAAWVREQGPRFLIFAWERIDDRHPWTEAPATWLEVYRWYNTRLSAGRNVLLERRSEPRFLLLEPVRRFRVPSNGTINLPESREALFWSLTCDLSSAGKVRKLLFRVPEVRMTVEHGDGERSSFRAIPGVLISTILGNYLPNNLAELAAVLDPVPSAQPSVRKITLGGPGLTSYSDTCTAEIFMAVTPASARALRPAIAPDASLH